MSVRAGGAAVRPITRWFESYSADHQHPANQRLHMVCVPAILFAVVALLWCIPVPGTWFRPGAWAAFAMFLAFNYYFRLSRPLAFGMLGFFVLLAWVLRYLHAQLGSAHLATLAAAVFVLGWVGQFIGHHVEGRRPSFLTDLQYLMIGPVWVLAKLYQKFGIAV